VCGVGCSDQVKWGAEVVAYEGLRGHGRGRCMMLVRPKLWLPGVQCVACEAAGLVLLIMHVLLPAVLPYPSNFSPYISCPT
jgi:hypothetical protein